MPTILLRAKDHDAPTCESFGDESAVSAFERAVREHRAWIAEWRVEHRGDISETSFVQGVRHLVAAGRALLADDMGLGKTAQALATCEVLRARGEASHVLVVTSASLKDQWAQEGASITARPARTASARPAASR